jgi:hypothetical protein
MQKRRFEENFRSERAARASGKDNLLDLTVDSLFDELEELGRSHDDELKAMSEAEDFTEDYPTGFKPYDEIWRYEPVESRYFFDKMLGEKLTDKQQEAMDVLCGKDPFQFTDLDYDEAVFMWGKGSGKDSTVSKGFVYQAYKLCCMTNPQAFLGLGKGSPMDIVNVASNSQQARNIFFKYLQTYIKAIKDTDTNLPWFSTRNFYFDHGGRKFKYMDLRERDGDIKKTEVDFHRGLSCHSLTSEKFTAEGLTIVLAVMDEIGAMKADRVFGSKAKKGDQFMGQYDSLGTSVRRSSKHGKLMAISYKYGANCPMSVLYRMAEKDPKVYCRKYSTYQVRTDKSEKELREQFRKDYERDPEKAKMIYECKDPDNETDRFYSNPYIIDNCKDTTKKFAVNPTRNKIVSIDDVSRDIDTIFDEWFVGEDEYYYAVHLDLAKGQVWQGGDAAGIGIGHMQEMRVRYDKVWIDYYKKTYGIDLEEYQGQLRIGIVMDLLLQITCKREAKELRIADVRRLVIALQERRKFGIIKVTADKWGSEETIQEFNKAGIEAAQQSVDRTKDAWFTQKDYIQQGLFRTYKNGIWEREMKELLDVGNKIDHPDVSAKRLEEEGYELGSKELADCSAAVSHTLVKELGESGEVFFA